MGIITYLLARRAPAVRLAQKGRGDRQDGGRRAGLFRRRRVVGGLDSRARLYLSVPAGTEAPTRIHYVI